jgi:hypothetical protein
VAGAAAARTWEAIIGRALVATTRPTCGTTAATLLNIAEAVWGVSRWVRGVVETCGDGGQWCGGGAGGWTCEGAKARLVTAMRRKGRHDRAFARRRGVAVARAPSHRYLWDQHVACLSYLIIIIIASIVSCRQPGRPIYVVELLIMLFAPAPSFSCHKRNPGYSRSLSAARNASAPQDATPRPTAYKRLKKYT